MDSPCTLHFFQLFLRFWVCCLFHLVSCSGRYLVTALIDMHYKYHLAIALDLTSLYCNSPWYEYLRKTGKFRNTMDADGYSWMMYIFTWLNLYIVFLLLEYQNPLLRVQKDSDSVEEAPWLEWKRSWQCSSTRYVCRLTFGDTFVVPRWVFVFGRAE